MTANDTRNHHLTLTFHAHHREAEMLVYRAVQLLVVASSVVMRCDAAASRSVKLCGRKLSDIMSRICKVYNSPSWDLPTAVEYPPSLSRRRRQTGGIADECCTYGCTYEQLSEYCSVSANTEMVEGLEEHLISDRSAESSVAPPAPAAMAVRREVGRSGGYARRRRRCPCRRGRGRPSRRPLAMGNTSVVRNAARAAPVVGTVSPLLTWGRTVNINADLPRAERDRYAYVAVYNI